jgi:hypothetical protein
MPMRNALTIFAVLFCSPIWAQDKQSEFCASRTTEAYHSPQCDWYVVRDPHRVNDVKIPHQPRYHTYSRWVLGDRTYIFAYRDIDRHPDDMVVDIYALEDGTYRLIGNARIPGLVTGVLTAGLTGAPRPDVIIRFEGGQLQYIDVLRFPDNSARQVFQYAASSIDIFFKPKPLIQATSKISNKVEEFTWDSEVNEFRKTEQHAWRNNQ